jgi:hypothetical protein
MGPLRLVDPGDLLISREEKATEIRARLVGRDDPPLVVPEATQAPKDVLGQAAEQVERLALELHAVLQDDDVIVIPRRLTIQNAGHVAKLLKLVT